MAYAGRLRFALLACCLLAGACPPLPAQNAGPAQPAREEHPVAYRPFDEKQWKKITEGLRYEDGQPLPPRSETDHAQPATSRGAPQWEAVLKTLAVVLLLAALTVLVIYLIRKRGLLLPPARVPVGQVSTEAIEANLPGARLSPLIEEAIALGQYALAIRLYYLAVLQALGERQLIRWRREKTNRQYLRELAGSRHAGFFRELTLIFEYTWYGQQTVTEPAFRAAEAKFVHLLDSLRQP